MKEDLNGMEGKRMKRWMKKEEKYMEMDGQNEIGENA